MLQGIPRESLGLSRKDERAPLEDDVTRIVVDVFCLGETVAVRLFRELRDKCTIDVARRALDRILRDEVRHRDFGWTVLPWLLEQPFGPRLRVLVEHELPAYFGRMRSAYLRPVGNPFDDADRAWGLMPLSLYASALEKTLRVDWIPRFSKLGFHAEAAFNAAIPPP